MTKLIACDQATTTGYCFAGSDIPLTDWQVGHFVAPKRNEEGERLLVIYDTLLRLIDKFQPDLIVYESPFDPTWDSVRAVRGGEEARPQFKRSTMQFLQRVKAAVIMAAARRSLPTEEYQPRSWRTVLQLPKKPPGAGPNWIKEETRNAIRRYGISVKSYDEADAAGLAFYAIFGKAGVARATDDLFVRMRATL